jgi:hypothetical protein
MRDGRAPRGDAVNAIDDDQAQLLHFIQPRYAGRRWGWW